MNLIFVCIKKQKIFLVNGKELIEYEYVGIMEGAIVCLGLGLLI